MLHRTDEVSVILSSIHFKRSIFLPPHLPGYSSLSSISEVYSSGALKQNLRRQHFFFQWEAEKSKPPLLLLSLQMFCHIIKIGLIYKMDQSSYWFESFEIEHWNRIAPSEQWKIYSLNDDFHSRTHCNFYYLNPLKALFWTHAPGWWMSLVTDLPVYHLLGRSEIPRGWTLVSGSPRETSQGCFKSMIWIIKIE